MGVHMQWLGCFSATLSSVLGLPTVPWALSWQDNAARRAVESIGCASRVCNPHLRTLEAYRPPGMQT